MCDIATPNLLLRAGVELPRNLKLPTEEFQEGWDLSRSDVFRLEKRILNRGWSFIRVAGGPQSYGVGDTSQEAVANALQNALRRLSKSVNAAEVECVELTEYRWFFLARMGVCPYRIQQRAASPGRAHTGRIPDFPERKTLPRRPAPLHRHSGRAVPMLRERLILSRTIDGNAQ